MTFLLTWLNDSAARVGCLIIICIVAPHAVAAFLP